MYRIVEVEELVPNTKLYWVEAPQVARKALAGQFAVVRYDERGERIPVSICDKDPKRGTVAFVIQATGATTRKFLELQAGDSIATFLAPLGHPSHIEHFGTCVLLGGGFGVAAIYPVAKALRELGNTVISLFGARHKGLIFWEDHLRAVSDEVYITTNDGSYGREGLVVDPLKEMLAQGRRIDLVHAVGPVPMMRVVADITRPHGIRTYVSLNPIMVDATGLCGSCRVQVGDETKFGCIDGPDFDAHLVDWDILAMRQRMYLEEEKRALEKVQAELEAAAAGRGRA